MSSQDNTQANAIASNLFHPSKESKPLTSDYLRSEKNGVDSLVLLSNETDKARKAIVYFHANYGNVTWYTSRLEQLQDVYPLCDIWTFDYPSFGKTSGSPNQKTVLESALCFLKRIESKYESWDWVGESIGAAVCFGVLKSKEPEFKLSYYPNHIAVINAFASIGELANEKQTGAQKIVELLGYEFPTERWIQKTIERLGTNAPKMTVIRSRQDTNIPLLHAQRLAAVCKCTLKVVQGTTEEYVYS